jgi:ribonuclease J
MTVAAVAKPKYFIPIGGTITKMRAYTNMIVGLGIEKERVFENLEGDSVEFSGGVAKKGQHIDTKPVYISQGSTDQVNPIVIKDRSQLSTEGVFVVVIPSTKDGKLLPEKAEIVTRGFIYVKGSQELMDKSKKFIVKNISNNLPKSKEWQTFKRRLESDIGHFLYKETSREPLVIVHTINV